MCPVLIISEGPPPPLDAHMHGDHVHSRCDGPMHGDHVHTRCGACMLPCNAAVPCMIQSQHTPSCMLTQATHVPCSNHACPHAEICLISTPHGAHCMYGVPSTPRHNRPQGALPAALLLLLRQKAPLVVRRTRDDRMMKSGSAVATSTSHWQCSAWGSAPDVEINSVRRDWRWPAASGT